MCPGGGKQVRGNPPYKQVITFLLLVYNTGMEQTTFFEQNVPQPLAARLRPRTIDEIVGQSHLLGEGKVLRRIIESDGVSSMIFWGPPGVGKTTIATVIANQTKAKFIEFSAVTSGIKEIREVMKEADNNRLFGEKTIVFVDEIHRFNKAQQDAFLPFVEKGSIILIGATTENPSFEVNGALLSRCKVFVLKALEPEEVVQLLRRAIDDPRGFGDQNIDISDEMLMMIARFSNGDARNALSTLEMVILNGDITDDPDAPKPGPTTHVSMEVLEQVTSKKSLLYDKDGEEHYNLISALHKSMRNSDPDAAVYWHVGLADPRALELSIAAYQACHFIGMPECSVHLTEAVIYNALAPKSNAMEVAYLTARKDALEQIDEPVPLQIRNAPTKLMKDLDYGKDYQYAHDYEDKITTLQCLPDSLEGREYYKPGDQGFEPRFRDRLNAIKQWRREHREQEKKDK